MIGYKVMRYERGRAISGADSRQGFPVRKGHVIRMTGKGTFLSPNKRYVLDYYGGNADREVLLTLKFDPDDITSGANTLNDREPELTVKAATIIDFEIINNEESVEPPRKTLFSEETRAALLEATYETDLDARTQAERTWDHLVRYVKRFEKRLSEIQLGHGDSATDGFMVMGPDGGLPHGVLVAFMKEKEGTGGSYTRHPQAGHIITLYGALVFSDDPDGLATRLERIPKLRHTFIHEFTHYMDQERSRGGDWMKRSAKGGSGSQYYQTPQEFNAYFQETASVIEDAILDRASRDPSSRDELMGVFENFNSFWKHITKDNRETRHWLERFKHVFKESKWERKWMKRMHVLYRGLKVRVESRFH